MHARRVGSTAATFGSWFSALSGLFLCAACSAGTTDGQGGNHNTGANGEGATDPSTGGSGAGFGGTGFGGGSACEVSCSPDLHEVVDCNGQVIETCTGTEGCSGKDGTCTNACQAAVDNQSSVGCEYYSTFMDQLLGESACFAAFIANTWDTPVHVTVEYQGSQLNVGSFGYIPSGSGVNQTYTPIDPAVGIPPGEVGILFLSGGGGQVPCPAPAAVTGGAEFGGTGVGNSFRIQTDVPVVAYQMNPYGGGSAATTAASLLLPTSVWGTNYVAANAGYTDDTQFYLPASMNVVAMEDATTVTMVPTAAVVGGGAIPAAAANVPFTFTLNRGQHAQFTQTEELFGSIISSDKPVGFMAGNQCERLPVGYAACDHAEQMVPPVSALGSEYVGVMYRSRQGEPAIWTLVGAVDGTQLTWTGGAGGNLPPTLNRGQVAEVITADPFVVKSQDDDHPFELFGAMSGCWWDQLPTANGPCYGDPDWVISVPPRQYDYRYVFFTDPTYPETNLVLVRAKENGAFADVNLDCLGVVSGWTAVGDYEWARVDLSTGNFQPVGNCANGRHEIESTAPFGLWVWAWGTPLSSPDTSAVSYGFPGGMRVKPINTVVIPPTPE